MEMSAIAGVTLRSGVEFSKVRLRAMNAVALPPMKTVSCHENCGTVTGVPLNEMVTSAGAAPWPMKVTNGFSTATRSMYFPGAIKMFARSVSVWPSTASTALCTVGNAPFAPLGLTK